MIAHVVLFRPRVDLSAEARQALATSFEAALTQIPVDSSRPCRQRIAVGRPYESLMEVDYSYTAIIEFDDRAGLIAYLDHPTHEQLASQFFGAFEEALMYDFELRDDAVELAALRSNTQ